MAPLAISVSIPGLLTLVGAVALMSGGVALIASEIRGRREVLARRVDLDGASSARVFRTNDLILPGHYEMMVQTGPLHYTLGISVLGTPSAPKEFGWFGVDLGNSSRLTIALSETPATIAGTVSTNGKTVAGAIVYLESFDPALTDPRLQLWSARTDHTGKYSFPGLVPGRYRLLSSFDFDPEDRFAIAAGPVAHAFHDLALFLVDGAVTAHRH